MRRIRRWGDDEGDLLLEAPFEFCADDPILGPFAAVDVPLRVVVTDCLFLGDVVGVAYDSRAFGGRKVWSLKGFRTRCE